MLRLAIEADFREGHRGPIAYWFYIGRSDQGRHDLGSHGAYFAEGSCGILAVELAAGLEHPDEMWDIGRGVLSGSRFEFAMARE